MVRRLAARSQRRSAQQNLFPTATDGCRSGINPMRASEASGPDGQCARDINGRYKDGILKTCGCQAHLSLVALCSCALPRSASGAARGGGGVDGRAPVVRAFEWPVKAIPVKQAADLGSSCRILGVLVSDPLNSFGMSSHESWSPWYPFEGYDIGFYAPLDKGGVYCIADSGKNPVYVGMTKSLQERLGEHRSGSSDQSECIRAEGGEQFRFLVIENTASRESVEALLLGLRPTPCNRR